MKTNPFAYLTKAPKLKGYRVLRPSEKIRLGDLFTFMAFMDVAAVARLAGLPELPWNPVPADPKAHMHVGGTLRGACKSFGPGFDGIVYRKSSKK
jgi:hypothetical protein